MHTLGQGESRDGPIGTLGRSGRRLRTNRSAAVLGCCKNLRLCYLPSIGYMRRREW